jgi:hypothetical protein
MVYGDGINQQLTYYLVSSEPCLGLWISYTILSDFSVYLFFLKTAGTMHNYYLEIESNNQSASVSLI